MQPEAYLPTEQHPPHTGAVAAEVPPPRRRVIVAIAAGALLLGLLVGIGIGRAIGDDPPAATAPVEIASDDGHLAVTSTPADGNVTLDGRFVGVTPIERLDLDPGKHTIVIDVYGYQPYSGTLAIEPRGKLNFRVLLAPIGGTGTTTGTAKGAGTATVTAIPPSALGGGSKPAGGTPAPPARGGGRSTRRAVRDDAPPPPPPRIERPRRDCSGDKYRCTDGCRSAENSCRFDCPGCVSCSSSVGWDKCKQQCDSCRSSCEQNRKFCDSSCSTQYDSCQASQ